MINITLLTTQIIVRLSKCQRDKNMFFFQSDLGSGLYVCIKLIAFFTELSGGQDFF